MYHASIPDELMLSWESQAIQFPDKDVVGLSHWGVDQPVSRESIPVPREFALDPAIDIYLWRDMHGTLRGILYVYMIDMPPWEKKGNVNIFVEESWRRKGLGTVLLTQALRDHEINFYLQRYSVAGLQFIKAFRGQ